MVTRVLFQSFNGHVRDKSAIISFLVDYSENPSHRIVASIKNVFSFLKPFFLSCFEMKQLRVLSAHWERIIILVNILRGPD